MTTVALVSLGRGQAMGEVRRVASWRQLFAATGAAVVEIPVAPDRRPHVDGAIAVTRGVATPERLAWSGRHLRNALAAVDPDVVVVVSTRAFDPRTLPGRAKVVLDQVDSLTRSYRDRATLVDGYPRRVGYRALAAMHARVERRLRSSSTRRVAAGWSDALTLNAEWVPNMTDPDFAPIAGVAPDTDVLFFGTLRYPPNVDALERMGRLWPALQTARPGTTALVAGSAPTPSVVELCRLHNWELMADFTSLPEVAARARIALAPLSRVAGIQNKVLDAASVGLAQVVTPEAIEGFRPGLPIEPNASDAALVEAMARLLDDAVSRADQVAAMQGHLRVAYSAPAWTQWAERLLSAS